MARGYGSALALPIWAEVMSAAPGQRYPATGFRPPEPLQRVAVCSTSSALATTGCERAGSIYTAELPVSCVPTAGCELHRGGIVADTDSRNRDLAPKRSLPQGIFRSFRKFFGGE
jgi:penicillin-binding protein 1A